MYVSEYDIIPTFNDHCSIKHRFTLYVHMYIARLFFFYLLTKKKKKEKEK